MASDAPSEAPVPAAFVPYVALPILAVLVTSLRPASFTVKIAVYAGVVVSLYRANQLIGGDDVLVRYSMGSAVGGTAGVAWWYLFVLPSENVQLLSDHLPLAALPTAKRFRRLLYLWVSPRQVGWRPTVSRLPRLHVRESRLISMRYHVRHPIYLPHRDRRV